MTVVWERPGIDGGSDIDGYYLEKREKTSLRWFKVIKNTIRDTRQKVSNLLTGKDYQYRVCAVNKAGAGPYSEESDLFKAADAVGMLFSLLPSWNITFTFGLFGRHSYPQQLTVRT